MKQIKLLIILLLLPSLCYGLMAFPSAEGLGKYALGGRGGTIYQVSNLNNSGAGSFREAVEASGPRIIIFRVSGDIRLTATLTMDNPYCTIAGQTSPGGISVSGKQFNVATHDVIIRHMRFRAGGHEYTGDDSDGDSFDLFGPYWNGGALIYNVILDHVSATWGVDESMSITGGATATTLQYCLIGPGLKEAKSGAGTDHAKGLLISGKYEEDIAVSLYRNYFTSRDRVPMMLNPILNQAGSAPNGNSYIVDGRNNVSYNWKGGNRPEISGNAHVNWIHNYTKEGPTSNRQDYVAMIPTDYSLSPAADMAYMLGNIGEKNTDGTQIGTGNAGEWIVSDYWHDSLVTSDYQAPTAWAVTTALPYSTMTTTLASTIVQAAGATIPLQDSVDTAVIDDFLNGTAVATDPYTVTYPTDWPTYSTASDNPTDTDGDGIPDTWEDANGFDKTDAADATTIQPSGYMGIELWINGIAGDSEPSPAQVTRTISGGGAGSFN